MNVSQAKKKNRVKRRLLFASCLMVGLTTLLCIGGIGFVLYEMYLAPPPIEPVVNAVLSAEEQALANHIFHGQQENAAGRHESVSLHLYDADRQFELQTLFLDRSDQPTTRTGRWGSENGTLWLDIQELDGEPVSQAMLQFQTEEGTLVAQQYDRLWFDYDVFTLVQTGEVVVGSAE